MGTTRSTAEYPLGEGDLQWTCTEWLEEHIDDDLLLIDCQPNIHDYIQEHIPGAVYMNPELFRVSEDGVPGRYIPDDAAQALFRRVGVDSSRPTVIYTGTGPFKGWGDGLEQTMVAYSLLRFGAKDLWLLDGGIDTWKYEGRQMSQLYPEIKSSRFGVGVQSDLFVEYDDFKDMKDNDDVILLDARPAEVYQGQGPWRKPGHIPGAVNLPWKSLFHDDNTRLFNTDEEIKSIAEAHGATPDKRIICSCGTGREATAEFLIFKYLLGYDDVLIYEGSYTEWLHRLQPTVTGPNPR
ncbi:MAG: sulfurtransferase [candidate division WS1 bacterium]|nr:sulfurtransferase [candidate division WS1 bacterium]